MSAKAAFYDVDGTLVKTNIVHTYAYYAMNRGSLTGIAIALFAGIPMTVTGPDGQATEVSVLTWLLDKVGVHGWSHLGRGADVIGVAMFAVLCFVLYRAARSKMDA